MNVNGCSSLQFSQIIVGGVFLYDLQPYMRLDVAAPPTTGGYNNAVNLNCGRLRGFSLHIDVIPMPKALLLVHGE